MTAAQRQGTLDEVSSERDVATFNRLFAFLSGSACSVAALTRRVEQTAVPGDVLDHVRVAAALAEELSQTGDTLLGSFVDRARKAGRSWSDIGRALGVTKQAAHERFVGPDLSRFTDRARAAVVLASDEAGRLGYRWAGAEHVLLGLLSEGSGIAARTLQSLGLTLDGMRDAVLGSVPGGGEAGPGEMAPPLTPQAIRLLGEAAPTAAAALGHNYVGTEHLLLALCGHPDGCAVLGTRGVTGDTARARVLELLTNGSAGVDAPQ